MIEIKEESSASPALAKSIFAVLENVYSSSPWSLEQIKKDMSLEQNRYFLAYDKEEVVAFLAIQESLFENEITQIAVKKAYQGKGLARQLLEFLGRDKDTFLEVRVSNQSAQKSYLKNGFKEIARRRNYYHEPVEDAIIMKRECNER